MAVVTSLGFSLYSSWDGKGARRAAVALDTITRRATTTGDVLSAVFGKRLARKLSVFTALLGGVEKKIAGMFVGEKMASGIGTFAGLVKLELLGVGAASVATSAVVGAALSALPVLFFGIGAAAAIASGQVTDTWNKTVGEIQANVGKLAPVFAPILNQFLERSWQTVAIVSDVATAVGIVLEDNFVRFGDSILDFIEILMSGLGEVAIKAGPALDALGGGLVTIAEAVVTLFQKFGTVVPEASSGLTAFFDGVASLMGIAGDLLVVLTKVSVHALPFMSNLFKVIGAIVRDILFPAFEGLIPIFDALATSGLSDALIKIIDALKPLVVAVMALLAPIFKTALPLVVGAFKIIGSVISGVVGIVVPIINGLRKALEFLGPRGTAAALAVFLLGKMLLGFVVKSAAQAGIAIGRLAASHLLLSGGANKAMVAHAKTFLAMKLGWIKTSAIAMAHAAKMAVAWLIALGPIGIIIAVVAAVVAAIIIFWDKIKAPFITVWNAILGFMKKFWPVLLIAILGPFGLMIVALIKNWDKVKAALVAGWDKIKAAASAVWNFLKTAFQPVLIALQKGWDKLKSVAVSAWDRIKTALKPVIDFVSSMISKVKDLWSGVGGGGGVLSKIKAFLQPVINWVKQGFDAMSKAISAALKFLQPVFDWLGRVASTVFRFIVDFIKNFVIVWFKVLATIIKIVFQVIVTIITTAVTIIVMVIKGIIASVKFVISIVKFLIPVFKTVFEAVANVVRAGVNIVSTVFRVIVTVFKAVWNAVLAVVNWVKTNIIDKMIIGFRLYGAALGIIWNAVKSAFQAVWDAVVAVVNWVKTNVIDKMIVGFRIYGAVLSQIWNNIKNVFTTVWNAIKTAAITIWNAIKDFLTGLWNGIKNFLTGLWNQVKANAITIFNAVKKFLSDTWNAIKSTATTVWNAIKGVVTGVWDKLKSAIETVVNKIKSIWDGLKGAAETIWNKIKGIINGFRDAFSAVKDKIVGFVDNIKDKWNDLKDSAESAWNKIKDMIKTPVKFVIDTVYNDGIRKFWNWIDNKLFGGDHNLEHLSTSGFASGGTHAGHVWGRGSGTSDSVPARLSRGEHVWTAREVAAAGGHSAVAALRSRALHGKAVSMGPGNGHMAFAKGGAWYEDLGSLAKNFFSSVFNGNLGDVLTQLPDKIAEYTTDFAANVKELPEGTEFQKNFKAKIQAIVDKVIEVASTVLNAFGGSGEGPGDYKAMSAWIKDVVPGTTISSGLRKGDPGYHGKGQAIDMIFSDSSERKGGGKALKAFNAIVATWKAATAELIWDFSPWSKGSNSTGLWNGAKHTFNSATSRMGTHADHIHWASTKGSVGGAIGDLAGVEKWRSTVANVLSVIGVHSKSNIDAVLEAIRQESSGNPSTVNNWDSNAKAGTPSKGLMQVIQPTFDAYAGPYKSLGLFNPFANIYAAVKYAMDRYGSGWQAKITAPGGYRAGGFTTASYDQGGMLQPGWTLAYNGTGRPEPVGHDLVEGNRGDTFIINFNGPVSDRQGAEDMVVRAITDAKKKGRI